MTPEGRIKQKIKKVLDNYEGRIYYHMPVPGGFGTPTLDYLGCFCGRFFAIEAKKPGGTPTPRQGGTMTAMSCAGAMVFLIDSDTGVERLRSWLAQVEEDVPLYDRWKLEVLEQEAA